LTGLTVTFFKQFFLGLSLTSPLLLSLAVANNATGTGCGKKGGMDTVRQPLLVIHYRKTVGYGDIRPVKQRSKILALLIAFPGLVLSGIVIAVAVQATTLALRTTSR